METHKKTLLRLETCRNQLCFLPWKLITTHIFMFCWIESHYVTIGEIPWKLNSETEEFV